MRENMPMPFSCSSCQYDLGAQRTGVGGGDVAWVARMLVAVDNGGLTVVAIGQGTLPLGAIKTLVLPSLSSGSMCSRRRSTRGIAVGSSPGEGRIL